MKIDFESFLKFRDQLHAYEHEPRTNDEFAYALEVCSLNAGINLPNELLKTVRKFDVKHFVAKLDDILEEISLGSELPVELLKKDPQVMDDLMALPYSLNQMAMALDMKKKHFANTIFYDMFLYNAINAKKDDDVCEIASLNGYLPALIGMSCRSVTMFNLTEDLHGLPENNFKLAGYDLGNITIINDSCPYRKTLHDKSFRKKFSKVYSNLPLTPSQYSDAKKLLKPKGILFTPVVSKESEVELMYFDGKDNLLATLDQSLPTLEEELKFN